MSSITNHKKVEINNRGIKQLLLPLLCLMTFCISCVGVNKTGAIKMYSSPNFNERKFPVSMLILHYTVIPTCEESLARLSDPTNEAGRVSAHYLVDRDGTRYGLVDESKRAWHAGVGIWAGMNAINDCSIGIEIVNVGLTEDGKREPFPDAQIDAVIKLCRDIQSRYPIKYVLGHSDVAPQRKQDPGEAFPWKKLAEAGIGIWTDAFAEPKKSVAEMLAGIGYDVSDIDKATIAFQRHWYPEAITEGATNTVGRMAAIYDIIQAKLMER